MNGWDEHEHPRWPAHTPDSRGGEFRGDGPGGWLDQTAGPLRGFMTHAQLESYVDRKDYTVDPNFTHGGNSALTQLRVYSDGRQLIAKEHDMPEDDRDPDVVEVTSSYIGWAIGAPVPAVVPGDEYGLTLSEYIPGKTGGQVIKETLGPDAVSAVKVKKLESHLATTLPGSMELGLLDILIGNTDRHPGNWLLTPDGRVVGIDHANADFGFPAKTSPFTGWFVDRDYGTHVAHPMTEQHVVQIRHRLVVLGQRGMLTEHQLEDMLSTLALLRRHARPA